MNAEGSRNAQMPVVPMFSQNRQLLRAFSVLPRMGFAQERRFFVCLD